MFNSLRWAIVKLLFPSPCVLVVGRHGVAGGIIKDCAFMDVPLTEPLVTANRLVGLEKIEDSDIVQRIRGEDAAKA